MGEALALAEKALVLAEKLNALEVVADACLDLCVLLWFSGDFKKSREYGNRALATALDNGYLEIAVLAYYRVASALPFEEYEKFFEYLEKGLTLARKVGDIGRQSWFLDLLAFQYLLMGEMDRAIALFEEALVLSRNYKAFFPGVLLDLGYAYEVLGEWNKSEQYYDEAAAVSRTLTDWGNKTGVLFCYGRLSFDKGEYAKARESFEEGLKIVEEGARRTTQLWLSQFLIRTLIELGEIEKASALLDKLRGFALETEEKWIIADEMALRAALLRAQKKYAESIELFEKTLQEWQSIKAHIWNTYYFAKMVLCEYARVYLERNQEDDKEKAHSLLNQALEMFQKMGAKKDIEKILAKKKLLTA